MPRKAELHNLPVIRDLREFWKKKNPKEGQNDAEFGREELLEKSHLGTHP